MKIQLTEYTLAAGLGAPLRFAVVADLHNGDFAPVEKILDAAAPDAVLFPGDFADDRDAYERGLAAVCHAAGKWPVFCSLGNHEMRNIPGGVLRERLENAGAVLLDNTDTVFRSLRIGGLSTGYAPGAKQHRVGPPPPPDTAFLSRFAAETGPKLLLCHHPEYYDKYLAATDCGLIVAGHAHGGQWSLFGHGVFAPGQGLFPRYTHGVYGGRMVVSRGLCATHRIYGRFGNPREVVLLTVC